MAWFVQKEKSGRKDRIRWFVGCCLSTGGPGSARTAFLCNGSTCGHLSSKTSLVWHMLLTNQLKSQNIDGSFLQCLRKFVARLVKHINLKPDFSSNFVCCIFSVSSSDSSDFLLLDLDSQSSQKHKPVSEIAG